MSQVSEISVLLPVYDCASWKSLPFGASVSTHMSGFFAAETANVLQLIATRAEITNPVGRPTPTHCLRMDDILAITRASPGASLLLTALAPRSPRCLRKRP